MSPLLCPNYTFHILPGEIAIQKELSSDDKLESKKLICQYEEAQGQFKMKLQIFGLGLQDETLFTKLTIKLARHLEADCLTPHPDSMNPFDVLHVSTSGEVTDARLSPEAFEANRFDLTPR